ncbi:hypothetical protein VTK26DRAFT_6353 [Humicola hyalothermophila]
MRSVWSCSSCAMLLLFALVVTEATASHAGREREDGLHRIAKAQVTTHPLRRDEGECPADHSLCPAELNGGCCPSRYACAADSCYATTAAPVSCRGRSGFYACAASEGGGCCPVGLICGTRDECRAPAGVTYSSANCPADYYLCPSSLGYGCCMTGMGCAASGCYSTEPVTSTVTHTITATGGERPITITVTAVTVATPTPLTNVPETADNNYAAKFIPSSVPKVAALSPSDEADSGGGLSGGAIGGIIAGVVVLLIVVVVAAFLIIRRLKRVEDIMESQHGSTTGKKTKSQSQARMERYGAQLHSQDDEMSMSIDPLMVPSNTTNNSTPQPGAARGRADSTGLSPTAQVFYHPDDDPRSRHASPDFNQGYFDLPPGGNHNQPPMRPARMRASSDSTYGGASGRGQYGGYAYQHWRQQSNASELSADGSDAGGAVLSGSGYHSPPLATQHRGQQQHHHHHHHHHGATTAAELEGQAAWVAELPSATATAAAGATGAAPAGDRSRSGSGTLGQYGYYGYGGAAPGLGPLDESAEMMHGFYGRADQQAGQTAAGLGGDAGGAGGAGGGYHGEGSGKGEGSGNGSTGKPLPPPSGSSRGGLKGE